MMKAKRLFCWLPLALAVACVNQAQSAPILQPYGDYRYEARHQANSWLEIDTAIFEQNISLLQSRLAKGTKLCAVLKADAYGHGVDLLMPSVIKMDVPCIGIASNEEAKVARAHGYQGVITRIRNASISEVATGTKYNIQELVGSLEHAKAINDIAKQQGKTIEYHLAINAGGMDRNGLDLDTDDGKSQALELLKLPNLSIKGIMTHYAVEDQDYVRERLAVFKEQTDWLIKTAKLNRKNLTLHTANSFTTHNVPEAHLDMVRPGGVLYGEIPSKGYRSIMSFKTKVASIQFYKKGTSVGYDGTYTLTRDSYLANLPFGYADGYRRSFANKGELLIAGERVPVLGKISMNTTMVDITDIVDKVKVGDEVVIYGTQGNQAITSEDVEEMGGVSIWDLYTIWGNSNLRVQRP